MLNLTVDGAAVQFLPVARFLSVAQRASGMSQCLPCYHRWCGMQWTETDEEKKRRTHAYDVRSSVEGWIWLKLHFQVLFTVSRNLCAFVAHTWGDSHLVNKCTLCNSVLKMLFNVLLKLKCLWSAFISVHFKVFHLKKKKEKKIRLESHFPL